MVEFEANEYLRICREAIARITAEVGQIDAISVDTQGETMILTDEAGQPLAPAIVWLDNRADAEAREIEAQFGLEEIYAHTGQPEVTAAGQRANCSGSSETALISGERQRKFSCWATGCCTIWAAVLSLNPPCNPRLSILTSPPVTGGRKCSTIST